MADEDETEGWYRRKIGRKIEMGANRLMGWLLFAIGMFALLVTVSSETFSLATHWPSFLFVAVIFGLARLCFRAKSGIIEGFGDEADTPRKRS